MTKHKITATDTAALDRIVNAPVFFERNRVFRNYIGGEGFRALMGDPTGDNSFPEEWLASKVKAINPVYFGERDGVSVVEGTDIFLDDLLTLRPAEMLGGLRYDCLVKYLDSAIRLPVQVHPTPAFSEKHFASPYGKTEAWLVLAKRSEDACLYFGFKDKIDLATLKAYADRSLEERDVLTELINPVKVEPGDVYLIRAGLIHAIGAGCTILEVQEPTDFTIQIENWCGESRVTEQEKYLGLSRDLAMSVFDFDKFGVSAVEKCKIAPKTLSSDKTLKVEELIGYDDTPCFGEKRYTLTGGSFVPTSGPSVFAVVDGGGKIAGEGYERELKKGDYWFMPHAARGKFTVSGTLTLIECLPSRQE